MSKNAFEQTADIVIAMIQAGMIKPDFSAQRASTQAYAEDIASAYRTIFAAAAHAHEE